LTMSDRIAVLGDGRLQQMGSPQELYRRPRNDFVARFVGESNLFEAVLTGSDGLRRSFRFRDGQELEIRGRGGHDLAKGDRVALLARPEDARLGRPKGAGGLALSGRIKEVFFVGTHYKLVVDAGGREPLKVTVQAAEGPERQPVAGEVLDLWFPAERLHPLPAGEATS
jgi:spermidine/putrescine transport system ATP-binding protein